MQKRKLKTSTALLTESLLIKILWSSDKNTPKRYFQIKIIFGNSKIIWTSCLRATDIKC